MANSRRQILGGGAAALLASSLTPAFSGSLSAHPYEGLVASRTRMLSSTPSVGNHQINFRSAHFAAETLSTIRIVSSNFYNAGGFGGNPIADTGRGAATTITASVEYPAGTFTQIKFSGSATGSIPDGG